MIERLSRYLGRAKAYPARQFSLIRIATGLYLAVLFARLFPYGAELYSAEGMFPSPISHGFFPNLLSYFDSPFDIRCMLVAGIVLSLAIALGCFRRASAFLLWYVWAAFADRNPLTIDPALPFIGFLVLAFAIIPKGEPLSFGRVKDWYMPWFVYYGALFVLGASYTWSGLERLQSVSWQNGEAFGSMQQLAIARDTFLTHALLAAPTWFTHLQTWTAAGIFTLALPLLLIRKTRAAGWLLLTLAFLYAALIFELGEVVFGLMLFHVFVFDIAWLTDWALARAKLYWHHAMGHA